MDSLNFESQCEMPGIKCKSHAEMVTADIEKCKSPILRDGKKCLRERISTPIDVRNDAHFYLSNNPVSPVFADGKIEMTGEALHVETDSNKDELNLKQDSANKCTKLIDSWGLPKCIVDKYKVAGINEIFEWQRDCLLTGKALAGGMHYCMILELITGLHSNGIARVFFLGGGVEKQFKQGFFLVGNCLGLQF